MFFLSFPPLMSHFSWAFSFTTFCGTSPVGWLIRLLTCTNCSMMLRCLKDVQWAAFHGIVAASRASIRTPLRIDGALPQSVVMFNSSKVENPEWYPELRTGAPLKDMIRRDDARMHARVALRLWTFGLLTSSHHLIWQSARGGYCTFTSTDVHHHVLFDIWFPAQFYESISLCRLKNAECRLNSSAFIPKEGIGPSQEEIHSLR